MTMYKTFLSTTSRKPIFNIRMFTNKINKTKRIITSKINKKERKCTRKNQNKITYKRTRIYCKPTPELSQTENLISCHSVLQSTFHGSTFE